MGNKFVISFLFSYNISRALWGEEMLTKTFRVRKKYALQEGCIPEKKYESYTSRQTSRNRKQLVLISIKSRSSTCFNQIILLYKTRRFNIFTLENIKQLKKLLAETRRKLEVLEKRTKKLEKKATA